MSTGLRAGTNNNGYLQVNGTDVLTALSSGSIGIGTDNPGDSRLFIDRQYNSTYATNSYNDDFLLIKNNSTTDGTAASIYMLATGSGNSAAVGTINLIHTNNGSGALSFQTRNNGSMLEAVRIASTGNVGIGTDNPSTKLDIYRSGSGVAARFGKETIFGELQVDGQRIGIQGTRSSDSAISGFFVENPSSSGTSNFELVAIKTAGTERLRITSAGNVGIGTDDPDSILHVAKSGDQTVKFQAGGEMRLEMKIDGNTDGCSIRFSDSDAESQGQIRYQHSTDAFVFYTNGTANERLRISSTGNVGIGTDNPAGMFMSWNTATYGQSSFTPSGTGALGVSQNQPYGALAFRNNTDQGNKFYTSWIQSTNGAANYIDILIINGYMYRVFIKSSANSTVAHVGMFLIYGLNGQSGSYPPKIEKLGDSSNVFSTSVINYNVNQYDCTVRFTTSQGSMNQGVTAYVERIGS